MRKIFTLFSLTLAIYSNAQVICGTAGEGGTVTLTAPAGNVFTSIEYASYGTPSGSCGSFVNGGCHSINSASICSNVFVGQNSASIGANNVVFGDPCSGTPKNLFIQARYSSALPLKLISFTAQRTQLNKVSLAWTSNSEINSSHFILERSTDGNLFENAGSVIATGSGNNHYQFSSTLLIAATNYYRLKMVDIDGKHQYSNIVRINNNGDAVKLSVFPSPASEFITLVSSKKQEVSITNTTGQVISNSMLINGNQTINIASWVPGIYFIKTEEAVLKFVKY